MSRESAFPTVAMLPPRYDAIVVGARCGGAPTAMLVARQGARVLIVDRATFPSDSMRAHFVRGTGVAALSRWGLLARVAVTGAPPVAQYVTDFGDGPLIAPVAMFDDVEAVYAPRRIVLDALLVEAAAAAGAEVRQAFTVDELLWENGAVTGLRGRDRGGGTVTERTPLVVGADGLRSMVARAVEAPVYGHVPALTCGYFGYFDGPPLDHAVVTHYPDHFAFAVPTNDNLTLAFVAAPIARLDEFRADLELEFFRTINHIPWIADLMRGRRRVERWRGTGTRLPLVSRAASLLPPPLLVTNGAGTRRPGPSLRRRLPGQPCSPSRPSATSSGRRSERPRPSCRAELVTRRPSPRVFGRGGHATGSTGGGPNAAVRPGGDGNAAMSGPDGVTQTEGWGVVD
jgi:2-polyprenyl-6-methoxyphenol hydroxylase-like FAD-dependent oxidoreductase